jgi:hypothetical protein
LKFVELRQTNNVPSFLIYIVIFLSYCSYAVGAGSLADDGVALMETIFLCVTWDFKTFG